MVLVTGAGGFVGSNLVGALVACGAKVYCLIRPERRYRRLDALRSSLELLPLGLNDLPALKSRLKAIRPEVIYHLAAYGNRPQHQDFEQMIASDITGTEYLLQAAAEIPYRSFIHAGTSSEYGFKDQPMFETDQPQPMSYYAICKLAATNLCRFHSWNDNRSILTLRLFSVYGPEEDPDRLIPTALRSALESCPLPLTGGGEAHDFVYIDDVVDAFLRAPHLVDTRGQVINICSGFQHTNREVLDTIEKVLHTTIQVKEGAYPARSWDTLNWVGSNRLAEELLGWKPKHDLVAGLAATIAWFRSLPPYSSSYHKGARE